MGDVSEIASGSGSTILSIVEEPAEGDELLNFNDGNEHEIPQSSSESETAILNANVTVDQVLILTYQC